MKTIRRGFQQLLKLLAQVLQSAKAALRDYPFTVNSLCSGGFYLANSDFFRKNYLNSYLTLTLLCFPLKTKCSQFAFKIHTDFCWGTCQPENTEQGCFPEKAWLL